jgi:F-type H+-transporting ATPase subunit b
MQKRSFRLAVLGFAAAAAPAAASEGGGLGQALIQPQIGTIFWTLLTFAVMIVILGKVAWKPLLGALDAREQSIRASQEQARADRETAEGLLQQQRDLLAEARRERAHAVDQGREDAEKVKAEIMDEARKQRDQLMQQTEAQLDAGLRQARAVLRGEAADLAILAAQKLLAKTLDEPTHRKLVEDYLADLERSGDSLPS